MAESILNKVGAGRFNAYSAGSHPTGRVNPLAIEQLARHGYPTEGLHSKAWTIFTDESAPPMDFVIGVCDILSRQRRPAWPGNPISLWWHFLAPGAVQGTDEEIRSAFANVCVELERTLRHFALLPIDAVDRDTLISLAKHIPIERVRQPLPVHGTEYGDAHIVRMGK